MDWVMLVDDSTLIAPEIPGIDDISPPITLSV